MSEPTSLVVMSRPVLLVVVVAVLVTGCGDGGGQVPAAGESPGASPDASVAGSPSASPDASPAASPDATAGPPPTMAVVFRDARIALASPDGQVRRVLATEETERLGDVALSPDGASVYYARRTGESWCDAEVVRQPVDGGQPEVIAAGAVPAASPDGTALAYSTAAAYACGDPRVVVRDLATGAERSWEAVTADGRSVGPVHLDWHPAGRRLVVADLWETATTIRVLDTRRDERYADADVLQPPPQRQWDEPLFRGQQSALVVYEECCGQDPAIEQPEQTRLVTVDPATGEPTGELLARSEPFSPQAFDASGAHLLFTAAGDGQVRHVLWRWSDGHASRVTTGVLAADW